jgi:Domain of unknown function (DUF4359)
MKFGKIALGLLVVAGAMFFTNPNKDAYANYAANKFADVIQKDVCKGTKLPEGKDWEEVGQIASSACKSNVVKKVAFSNFIVKGLISSNTEQQNLLFLSFYTTEAPGNTFRTVGAFGNFLTFAK